MLIRSFLPKNCFFVVTADIGPIQHLAGIQTDRVKASPCVENFWLTSFC